MEIYLQNTLTGKKDKFEPIHHGEALMYHCGPTVYGEQHIGNLSMFVFTDVLRRTLEYAGYKVNQVINFTDIGHLSGDNDGNPDEGEDRMTKGLKREGMELTLENMKLLGKKYAELFKNHLSQLSINITDTQFPFASDFIEEQIQLVRTLEEKGFTYTGKEGVYFDTTKFPDYGKLGNINLSGLKEGARVHDVGDRKNRTDFLVWKLSDKMGWPSPWGASGFPGWHIECSAMIFKLLGEQIDIHTGGIEHIGIHHNNEIAQAEAASGKVPFSKFWLHREHIQIDESKISKSVGNVIYIGDLIAKKIHPLSFRYWLLTGNYKTPMNFTWEAVEGAQTALEKIIAQYIELPEEVDGSLELINKFEEAISDNLNTSITISLLQEARDKNTIDQMDEVLGLNIKKLSEQMSEIPIEIIDLQKARDEARTNKDFAKSDSLRSEIEQKGYKVNDTTTRTTIIKSLSSLI